MLRNKYEKIKTFQVCDAAKLEFEIKVPSNSKQGVEYTVKGSFIDGEISCTCPGFTYRRTCVHTRFKEARCGWSALESPEPQTLDQKQDHICPRCGSNTIDIASGDF